MNVEMMFSQLVKQSPWWSADNCSTCVFLGCKVLLKTKLNKIPIKLIRTRVTVWPLNNIIHSFFESLLMPERNENKPNYIENKINHENWVNFGKATGERNLRVLDLEGIKNNNQYDSQHDFNLQIKIIFPW